MSFIKPLDLVFLFSGFSVGFGHCIGMCGPIVVSLSLNLKTRSLWIPYLLYHAGRITTYAILGGLMGFSGSFTHIAGRIAGLQKGMMIFAGLLIIVMGVAMNRWISIGPIFGNDYNPDGVVSRSFRKLGKVQSTAVYFPLGLLLGLLPCGPVYTALVAAARTGMDAGNSIEATLAGMGLMVSFGVGTIPALLLVARLAHLNWLKHKAVIYKIGSILMIAVGIYFVIKAVRY
jgi:uncharacterized protein